MVLVVTQSSRKGRRSEILCLGIESTAHTFGVGIVNERGEILANEKNVFQKFSQGTSPADAAKFHEENCDQVIKKALEKAGVRLEEIDLLAYSKGPGMPPCLLVGLRKIRELAKEIRKPVVEVNHCVAHLEIGKLVCKCEDPVFLYLSGGNTQIISFSKGKYRVFGETLDIPLGNLIDCFARMLGLPFPGGEHVEKLAEKGSKFIELPYSVKGMDVSFTGILTKIEKLLKEGRYKPEDLAYSLQQVAFSMIIEVAERAMAHCKKKELLLIGGVARNKELQRMCKIMCSERNAKFFVVPDEYSMDNGVMIAWNGILARDQGVSNVEELDIDPKWRVDEVEVTWMR